MDKGPRFPVRHTAGVVKASEYDLNDLASIRAMVRAQALYEQQRRNEDHNKARRRRLVQRRLRKKSRAGR